MYLNHFNLTEQPFSIAPDPRFLYMSARHREALAHLLYGLGEGGGFVQLTGEVGTGKTTICRCLLEQVPDDVDIAVVLNPKVTAAELLATVCDELGIAYNPEASIKSLIDVLNRYLLDAHARQRRTVIVIDEAQNLSADVLEQVRLLTNLETSTQKLLQIILIGQPELRDMLDRDDMRQLAQRITARYHLEPINREEADAYIKHRLQICGCSKNLFTPRAVDRIQKLTEGIPRLINVLCDRSLLGAYAEGKSEVDHPVVNKAAREVLAAEQGGGQTRRVWPWVLAAVVLLAVAGAALVYQQPLRELVNPPQVTAPVTPAPVPAAPVAAEPPAVADAAGVDPEDTVVAEPAPPAETVVETPPDAAPDPAPLALAESLQQADSSWYRAAWTALFARWQVELPETVKPDFCRHAGEYGLFCLVGKGDWDTLRAFDRPAVLTLVREDGTRAQVYLASLTGDTTRLLIDGVTHAVPVDEVAQYWYGDYVLFLQSPPAGHLFLKRGDRNDDVAWLREQFEQVRGVRIPAAEARLFDDALHRQVVEFQRERSLLPDGIVGKHTMIHLNSYFGRADTPTLGGG